MCLAIPHTIVSITGQKTAVGRAGTVEVEVRTDLVENLAVGDTVLVHAGFAIEKLMSDEAAEIEALWDSIRAFAGQ